jgi:hypothetical protein
MAIVDAADPDFVLQSVGIAHQTHPVTSVVLTPPVASVSGSVCQSIAEVERRLDSLQGIESQCRANNGARSLRHVWRKSSKVPKVSYLDPGQLVAYVESVVDRVHTRQRQERGRCQRVHVSHDRAIAADLRYSLGGNRAPRTSPACTTETVEKSVSSMSTRSSPG